MTGARPWPVGGLAQYVRERLETDPVLSAVWVQGEVTNVFRARSGHCYFTLRDADGQLKTAFFRAQAMVSPYLPVDGDQVIVYGNVSVYPRDGSLQLYAELVQPAGRGLDQLRLELLRQQLEIEGLFDASRKRSLPAFPKTIGVVTSPDGSVWHDIQHVVRRRYPLVELVLAPARVQGDRAPESLHAALRAIDARPDIDVIIIGRGGGSAEDLAAFNDEQLARSVFACRHPVVSAVGHETDWSICDDVADVRAPTPSVAAELVTPSLAVLAHGIEESLRRLRGLAEAETRRQRAEVLGLSRRLDFRSPAREIERQRAEVTRRLSSLERTSARLASSARTELERRRTVIAALSPRQVLARGFAVVRRVESGTLVQRVGDVSTGDQVNVTVADGAFDAVVHDGPLPPVDPAQAARRSRRSSRAPASSAGPSQLAFLEMEPAVPARNGGPAT